MSPNLARGARAVLGACAAALALFAGQGTALADPCTNRNLTQGAPDSVLFDSGGNYFDTDGAVNPFSRGGPYATLDDSGSNGPSDTPPGPVSNADSYDSWGALFVGGDADSNMYWDSNDNGCTRELGGRQIAFARVNLGGLLVQRKLFVGASGLPGARFVEYLTNPGGVPMTTSVQVGDLKSPNNTGDFGSDEATTLRFNSSGSGVLSAADLWGVTTDAGNPDTDAALAHVFDGIGGAQRIGFAQLGGGSDSKPQDNLAYRWDSVTIAPGQTAAFMSFDIQQANAALDEPTMAGMARDQALAYEAAPLEQLYAGMSDAEIAAVRNWPKPQPAARLGVTPGTAGADNAPMTFSAAASTASSSPGICQGRSVAWDLGDGTKAMTDSVVHQFKAGQYDATLAVTNSCGQTATARQHVAIADKTAPTERIGLPKSTTLAKLAGGKIKESVNSSENATVTIVGTVPSAIAKTATAAKISKNVIKVRGTLTAGKAKKLKLKLSKKAAKRLRALGHKKHGKSFKLSVKTTVKDAAGNAKPVTKKIKVRF